MENDLTIRIKYDIPLPNGWMLIMKGNTNRNVEHMLRENLKLK